MIGIPIGYDAATAADLATAFLVRQAWRRREQALPLTRARFTAGFFSAMLPLGPALCSCSNR